MKKILLLSALFLTAFTGNAQETLVAYFSGDAPMTNILNKPMGATVMQLPYDLICVFSLTSPQDGWWMIEEIWPVEEDEAPSMTDSDTGEYWIHYTDLGLGTRNYGGQCLTLRAAPDEEAEVVFSFTQELELMPMDIQDGWVMVMVDGTDITGWIEAEWLCSNPLTNCC